MNNYLWPGVINPFLKWEFKGKNSYYWSEKKFLLPFVIYDNVFTSAHVKVQFSRQMRVVRQIHQSLWKAEGRGGADHLQKLGKRLVQSVLLCLATPDNNTALFSWLEYLYSAFFFFCLSTCTQPEVTLTRLFNSCSINRYSHKR